MDKEQWEAAAEAVQLPHAQKLRAAKKSRELRSRKSALLQARTRPYHLGGMLVGAIAGHFLANEWFAGLAMGWAIGIFAGGISVRIKDADVS